MCNGQFGDKDPVEAMDFLDLLAENARNWDTTSAYEAFGKTQPFTTNRGIHHLKEDHDLQAKFASLARKVEALEMKKSHPLKIAQEIVCNIYNTNDHPTDDCPTLSAFKECLHEQANAFNTFKPNNNPYVQAYNPSWRNHPNVGWRNDNQVRSSQHPFQTHHNPFDHAMKDLGETLQSFIAKQETFNSQTAQTLANLTDTLAKFSSTLSIHEKGKFPSQTLQNPKDQSNPSTSSSNDHYLDQVKSVITLCNGKVVENTCLTLTRKMMNQSLRIREGLMNLHLMLK